MSDSNGQVGILFHITKIVTKAKWRRSNRTLKLKHDKPSNSRCLRIFLKFLRVAVFSPFVECTIISTTRIGF